MQTGKLRKVFLLGIMLASVLSLSVLMPSHSTKAAPSQTTTTISIPAIQPWTDTGIDLTQGSSVSIIASGTIYIAGSDPGKTPDGDPTCTAGSDYAAPGLHCWSLIGNIANGTPFEVGSSTGFSASVAGRLYLGVNDNVFGDNSGNWTATVTVTALPPTVDLQTLDIHSLQPFTAGTNPTFRADIRNNGSAASGNFNIRWIADGTIFDGGHFSIPAGTTDTHDHIWSNITPGNHTLTFIANFDHGITESDYSNNQFTLTFTVAAPGSIKPGGMWVYPDNGFTFVKGNTYTIIVQGYQSKPTDPVIDYVNVTGYWNNAWHVICHIPNNRPDLGNNYYCPTNFLLNGRYPPSGKLTISFDVYDVAGNRNLAPNGTHTGTFSTSATSLSTAENILNKKATPILAAKGHLQAAIGEVWDATVLAGGCLVELFGAGLLKIPGKTSHAAKIAVKFYKIYDDGKSGSAIALDTVTGKYWDVFVEFTHAINPLDSCTTIVKFDIQILYISIEGLVKP